MGIASLVLGIVSLIIGFVPFCGGIALIPALVGLALGIIELVKNKKESKPAGMAIAGIVLCSIAIVVIIFWLVIVIGISASNVSGY